MEAQVPGAIGSFPTPAPVAIKEANIKWKSGFL